MFEYMTTSQIASLIIGIVFSVISIATTILAIKYAKKINSFAKSIALSLVAPTIAFIAWLFLIFSFVDGFRTDETLTLIVAIILAVIIDGMLVIVAKALFNKHQDEFENEEKNQAKAEKQEQTTQTQVAKEDVKVTKPLLLTNSNEKQTKDEEKVNAQKNIEYNSQEPSQTTDNKDVKEDANKQPADSETTMTQEEQENLEFEKFLEELHKKTQNGDKKDDE